MQEINIEKGFFSLFTRKAPQRIYIHGDVGRGKTFLMDMLFEEINHEKKIRLHFHRFMQNLHERLKNYEGATDPLKAEEGTLRKMYGISIDKNSVHGSDSVENAKIEIDFFFK